MSVQERDLVQLLGALSPVLGGVGGGSLAPDKSLRTGVSTAGGSLAGALGGGAVGGMGGAAIGGLGGRGIGALLASLTDQDVDRLAREMGATGQAIGGILGGVGGTAVGGGAGAGAGYDMVQGKSTDDQDDDNQQEKEGSDMTQQKHAYAINALNQLAENNIDPADYVKTAAQSNDPQMRKTASAIVEYDQDVRRTNQAFAVGALEKLAEYNIPADQFVKTASQGQNPTMRKIASAIVELDQAIRAKQQQEKTARVSPIGNPGRDTLGKLIDKIPSIRDLSGQSRVDQARQAAPTSAQDVQDAVQTMGRNNAEGHLPRAVDELQDAIQSRNRRVGGAAAAGVGGLGTAGAGGAYAMGDSGSTGSGLQDFANEHLGAEFDEQSRLQALLQGGE